MLLVFTATFVVADDETPPPTDNRNSEIEDRPSDDAQIVTATRTPIPYRDAASSATVIGEGELEAMAEPLLTDALRGVPGVDVVPSGPPGQRTSLFIRGTDSDHVKVLLDGIDIADPSTPGGIPLLLDNLSGPGTGRIEIIRGPQSTLYGSNAIGGVVHAITRSSRSGPLAASYEVEGGSFYTSRQRLTVEAGSERMNAFLAFSHLDTQGISASPAGTERDPFRNSHFTTRVGFDPSDELHVDTVLHYIHAQTEFDLFGADDPLNQTESEQILAKIEPRLTLLDGRWVSKINLNTAHHDRETFDRFFGPSAFGPGDIYSTKNFRAQTYEADWQNDIQVFDWNLLTVGAAYRHERSDNSGIYGEFPPPTFTLTPVLRESDDDRDIASLYLQDQIKLFDGRVHIVPGIRHDRYSDFGDQTTWRLAASYKHTETGTTLRGSYGTGFNAPSLVDLYDPRFSNRNLEAEESTGWDAGVEQELWKDKASIGVTYFQNDIDELIVAVFNPTTFAFLPQNVGEARTRGVEVFGLFEPCPNFVLRPSYTYTDTENRDTGERLLRRPLHKAGVEAIVRFLNERATLGVGVFYVGEREDFQAEAPFAVVTNDDYWLTRLSASYKITDHVEATARVENLFDERYQDILGFNSPPLAAYGGVRITY